MEVKEIDKKGRKQKAESRNRRGRETFEQDCAVNFEAQCKRPFKIIAWDYDSVNTTISD